MKKKSQSALTRLHRLERSAIERRSPAGPYLDLGITAQIGSAELSIGDQAEARESLRVDQLSSRTPVMLRRVFDPEELNQLSRKPVCQRTQTDMPGTRPPSNQSRLLFRTDQDH
jgi:hypothetical protein